MTNAESLVVLLPWLRLSVAQDVDGFEFASINTTDFSNQDGTSLNPHPALSEGENLKFHELVRSHVSAWTSKPINWLTIVRHKKGRKPWLVNSTHMSRVGDAAAVLSVACMAENRHFIGCGVTNSKQYEPIYYSAKALQHDRVALSVQNLSMRTTSGGHRTHEVKSVCPIECEALRNNRTLTDRTIVDGMMRCKENKADEYRRILGAIRLFALACSDSQTLSTDVEIVLAAAAFEHLLGEGRRDEVPKALGRLLDGYAAHDRKSSERNIANNDGKDFEWALHKIWIRELFTRRNNVIHPREDQWNYSWKDFEHHIFAVWLFPLALRKKLVDMDLCVSDARFQGKLRAVDKLLALPRWASKSPGSSGQWEKTLSGEQSLAQISAGLDKAYSEASGRR